MKPVRYSIVKKHYYYPNEEKIEVRAFLQNVDEVKDIENSYVSSIYLIDNKNNILAEFYVPKFNLEKYFTNQNVKSNKVLIALHRNIRFSGLDDYSEDVFVAEYIFEGFGYLLE